jgi:hypothetical protein
MLQAYTYRCVSHVRACHRDISYGVASHVYASHEHRHVSHRRVSNKRGCHGYIFQWDTLGVHLIGGHLMGVQVMGIPSLWA